jgi:NADH-quinone oxidoreductase subunit A
LNLTPVVADSIWPLLVYAIGIGVVVVAMLGLSFVLGPKHRKHGEPFESGIVTIGYGRFRLSAQFYLIAMFFVIFDLEAVFIYTWAVVAREAGWAGYIEVLIFISVLLAALVYLWRIGALEWGPHGHSRAEHVRVKEKKA